MSLLPRSRKSRAPRAKGGGENAYRAAIRDFEGKNYEAAEKKLLGILKQDPNHVGARSYLNYVRAAIERDPGRTMRGQFARTIIPKVDFEEAPLDAVIEFLRKKSSEVSKGKVVPNLLIQDQALKTRPVTLHADNLPLSEILFYVGQAGGLHFRYEKFSVVVSDRGNPGNLKFRSHDAVARARVQRLKAQLSKTTIPKVDFDKAQLGDVVEFLKRKVAEVSNNKFKPNIILVATPKAPGQPQRQQHAPGRRPPLRRRAGGSPLQRRSLRHRRFQQPQGAPAPRQEAPRLQAHPLREAKGRHRRAFREVDSREASRWRPPAGGAAFLSRFSAALCLNQSGGRNAAAPQWLRACPRSDDILVAEFSTALFLLPPGGRNAAARGRMLQSSAPLYNPNSTFNRMNSFTANRQRRGGSINFRGGAIAVRRAADPFDHSRSRQPAFHVGAHFHRVAQIVGVEIADECQGQVLVRSHAHGKLLETGRRFYRNLPRHGSAIRVDENIDDAIGIGISHGVARKLHGVHAPGRSVDFRTGPPVQRILVIGHALGMDEHEAEARTIRRGRPGRNVVVGELANGAVRRVLELDLFSAVAQRREIGKFARHLNAAPGRCTCWKS